jgi:hypothetical protein
LQVTTPCAVALYDVAHCVARPRLLLSLPQGDLVRGCAFAQRLVGGPPAAAEEGQAAGKQQQQQQQQRTVAFLLSSGSSVHAAELPALPQLGACSAACGLGPHRGPAGPPPAQLSLEARQLPLPYDMSALAAASGISYSPASGLLQLAVRGPARPGASCPTAPLPAHPPPTPPLRLAGHRLGTGAALRPGWPLRAVPVPWPRAPGPGGHAWCVRAPAAAAPSPRRHSTCQR